jgi:hypothetical protein
MIRLAVLCLLALPALGQGPAIPAPVDPPNYQPYSLEKKFEIASMDAFGPQAFLTTAAGAAVYQLENVPKEWHQGAEGYGLRYGSVFGMNVASSYFTFAIQSALHEDPRYFLSTDRTVKGRLKSVIHQAFLARKENGGEEFAFGLWGGSFGAGFVATAWQPRSQRGFEDGALRGASILGVSIGANFLQEFVPLFRRWANNK